MEYQTPKRLEIFLLLACRTNLLLDQSNKEELSEDEAANETENETEDTETDEAEKMLSVFIKQLSASDAAQFERLKAEYQNKSEEEKKAQLEEIEKFIGSDERQLDENIHWSHIDRALEKETRAMQRVIADILPRDYRRRLEKDKSTARILKKTSEPPRSVWVEKNIRRTFAEEFIALRDLPVVSAFDRLDGAQLVRLIRLAGIREVALACVRIEVVESVTAFLRRFAAADARAIAAQLNRLPKISDERLSFAEEYVQAAFENEPQPSEMLASLGIRLIGILLCSSADQKIAYAAQKLPLEVAPKLPGIIERQCRKTPANLQKNIAAEIEELTKMIISPKS